MKNSHLTPSPRDWYLHRKVPMVYLYTWDLTNVAATGTKIHFERREILPLFLGDNRLHLRRKAETRPSFPQWEACLPVCEQNKTHLVCA